MPFLELVIWVKVMVFWIIIREEWCSMKAKDPSTATLPSIV